MTEPTLKRAPQSSDANSAGRPKEPHPYSLLGLAAGKSSCARALSLLSFCPRSPSGETGSARRCLSQCSLHSGIECAEKP
jgi:hypothetical protein